MNVLGDINSTNKPSEQYLNLVHALVEQLAPAFRNYYSYKSRFHKNYNHLKAICTHVHSEIFALQKNEGILPKILSNSAPIAKGALPSDRQPMNINSDSVSPTLVTHLESLQKNLNRMYDLYHNENLDRKQVNSTSKKNYKDF